MKRWCCVPLCLVLLLLIAGCMVGKASSSSGPEDSGQALFAFPADSVVEASLAPGLEAQRLEGGRAEQVLVKLNGFRYDRTESHTAQGREALFTVTPSGGGEPVEIIPRGFSALEVDGVLYRSVIGNYFSRSWLNEVLELPGEGPFNPAVYRSGEALFSLEPDSITEAEVYDADYPELVKKITDQELLGELTERLNAFRYREAAVDEREDGTAWCMVRLLFRDGSASPWMELSPHCVVKEGTFYFTDFQEATCFSELWLADLLYPKE